MAAFTRLSLALQADIENLHELNLKVSSLWHARRGERAECRMHEATRSWESFYSWLDAVDRVHLAREAVLSHRFPEDSPAPASPMAERRAA